MADSDRPWQTGATEAERWDGYLDLRTGMLRTLSAEPIATAEKLREFEDGRVEDRRIEFLDEPFQGDFDLPHLQAIHRHLFQDVYPWAGEIRTVGISKGGQGFLPPEHVGFVVDGAARLMRDDGMLRPGMETDKWSSLLAERFNDVNEAHPFREGNGRTQRLYFDQVAEAGGKTIHWNVLTKEQNIAVSHAARDGDLAPLREALSVMVTDRMDPLALQRAKQAAEAMRASSATRSGPSQARGAGAGERAYYGRDGRTNGPGTTGPRRDGYGR
ncbi:Fic/DOC family protein [Curtobacterium sp. VKM Ac-1395]|uniref:Fic/DOC family protein n=1 Tax=Curtobacterium sp. VKM Ac-1395 TaxID=2783815 RepID=UPI00188B942C|nr:Fic family protein [Curtobacterium sp. VKM Ac-1395]MBF4592062.1 Fic family protein [Curtobacterium sp. VKM Ac-1395]